MKLPLLCMYLLTFIKVKCQEQSPYTAVLGVATNQAETKLAGRKIGDFGGKIEGFTNKNSKKFFWS